MLEAISWSGLGVALILIVFSVVADAFYDGFLVRSRKPDLTAQEKRWALK